MSDFDKEAERERLREKYERDKADREATQRMSDLLLKGARMTNTHCETCGDPYFQHEGVTFCPTCHGGPEGVEANLEEQAAQDEESATADAPAADAGAEPAAGETEIDVATPEESTDEATAEQGQPVGRGAQSDASPNQQRRPPAADRSTRDRRPASDAGAPGPAPTGDASGDLEAARDSLTAALEGFAAEASRTDDPRYAKECLEAAREAAEALAALR